MKNLNIERGYSRSDLGPTQHIELSTELLLRFLADNHSDLSRRYTLVA